MENEAFFDGCIRTYGAATRHMIAVWNETMGVPMDKLSGSPKERFQEAVRRFVRAMEDNRGARLRERLNAAPVTAEEGISLVIERLNSEDETLPPDVDDVPPSVFKNAIWAEANYRAGEEDNAVDVPLDEFLREVVRRVFDDMGWAGRFNVGANRHFPRMVQWLREVQEESTWDEDAGLRLMNRAGAGRVADYPEDPRTLNVRLNRNWL